jgi:hypothetical protein
VQHIIQIPIKYKYQKTEKRREEKRALYPGKGPQTKGDKRINSSSHYKKFSRKNLNLKEVNQRQNLDKIIKENTTLENEIISSSSSELLNDKEMNNSTAENKFHFEFEKVKSYNKQIKSRNPINIDNQKVSYLFILLNLFILNFSNQYNLINIYSRYSNITIKLRGSGVQSIFFGENFCYENTEMFTRPDEV